MARCRHCLSDDAEAGKTVCRQCRRDQVNDARRKIAQERRRRSMLRPRSPTLDAAARSAAIARAHELAKEGVMSLSEALRQEGVL